MKTKTLKNRNELLNNPDYLSFCKKHSLEPDDIHIMSSFKCLQLMKQVNEEKVQDDEVTDDTQDDKPPSIH